MSHTTIRTRPELDQALLARLASVGDPGGVLTVLANSSPASVAGVHASLEALDITLPLVPVHAAVEAASGARPTAGWGLVTVLSTGETFDFAVAATTPASVDLADTARLIPVARAFDASRPIGIIDVHRDHARIVETGISPVELGHVPLLPGRRVDWTRFKAPAAPNPLRGYHSSPQRERFEHRIDANRARSLRDLSRSIEHIAHRRGWMSLLIAGEADITREVAPRGTANLRLNRALPEWRSPADMLDDLRDELDDARELAVAALAEAAAARPNGFARGIAATGEALAQGRARTVVLEGPLEDTAAEEVVHAALARRLPVLFAHGELTGLHSAICELHG